MITPPELLTDRHDADSFACGEAALDIWLRRKALSNQSGGASKTYVVCDEGRVVGYYALAAGGVRVDEAARGVRRNMPDPIPMLLLGRLAVDGAYQGRGLGRALLRDAILRTLQAARIIGIRGLFVHAISDEAKRFYEKAGFQESPVQDLLLMISLKEAEKALGS